MSFKERSKHGKSLENTIKSFLDVSDIDYVDNGTEFGNSERYAPDILVNKKLYVECKNSLFIEKDAYLHYYNIYENDGKVLIIFKNHSFLFFSFVEELKFQEHDEDYQYFQFLIPVEDDIWISPRKLEKRKYTRWKQKTGGSGTPYAIIDVENIKQRKIKEIDFKKHLTKTKNDHFI